MRGAVQRICAAAALLAGAGACAAALEGYPDRVGDADAELTSLEIFMTDARLSEYALSSTTAQRKETLRDEFVFAKLRAIDIHFGNFQRALFTQGVSGGILADWIELALGGAGAVFSGPSQALSAASAGVVGAKSAFDREAYFENTLPTLLGAMEANRKTIKLRIYSGLAQGDGAYSLPNAMADLEDYYNAGTIPGALISINEDTGAKGKEAAKGIADSLGAKFLRNSAGDQLRSYWKPDGTAINAANEQALKDWMKKNGVDKLLITFFLRSDIFAEARVKAVKDLGL